MSALQQKQPDVYDLCMNCPDNYTYQETETIQPIIKDGGNKKCLKANKLNADDKKKVININFHASSDVKVLWNIDNWDCDLNSGAKCCLLKCEVIDVCNNNLIS